MPRSRPALYDRKQRGLIYVYTKEDHDRAQATYKPWPIENALIDLDAAQAHIADAGLAILGFCWGGSLAWLAACRRRLRRLGPYYGSMMPDFAHETARCPVMAHIGDRDNPATGQDREDSARRSRSAGATSIKAHSTASTTRTAPDRAEAQYRKISQRITEIDGLAKSGTGSLWKRLRTVPRSGNNTARSSKTCGPMRATCAHRSSCSGAGRSGGCDPGCI